MADQGSIGLDALDGWSQPTDHIAAWNGDTFDGLLPTRPWKFIEQPEYLHEFWHYPCVLDNARGQLYLAQGSNAGFRITDEAESPSPGDAWRWHHAGLQRLRWYVTAGENSLTVRVRYSHDAAPRPTVRVLPDTGLGIAENWATAPAGANTIHSLTLTVTATAAGVATLQLEYWNFTERITVDWIDWTL